MKKFIVVMLFALSMSTVLAQSDLTFWDSAKPEKQFVIGPRVGLNISKIDWQIGKAGGVPLTGDIHAKVGFNIGVAAEMAIFKSLHLNSGLYFTTRGLKYNDEEKDRYIKDTWSSSYIQIPIYASYRLNFSSASQVQVNFGPYFAYGVYGKHKYETMDDRGIWSDDVIYEEIDWDLFGEDEGSYGIKRFDVGLGIGGGYTFSSYYVGVTYEFGLRNLAHDTKHWSVKNRNLSISIGYNF